MDSFMDKIYDDWSKTEAEQERKEYVDIDDPINLELWRLMALKKERSTTRDTTPSIGAR